MALAASAAINTVPDFTRKILEIAVAIIMRPRTRLRPATLRAAAFARRCWKRPIGVPNGGGLRQARVKKGLTTPHGQNFDAGAWRGR